MLDFDEQPCFSAAFGHRLGNDLICKESNFGAHIPFCAAVFAL